LKSVSFSIIRGRYSRKPHVIVSVFVIIGLPGMPKDQPKSSRESSWRTRRWNNQPCLPKHPPSLLLMAVASSKAIEFSQVLFNRHRSLLPLPASLIPSNHDWSFSLSHSAIVASSSSTAASPSGYSNNLLNMSSLRNQYFDTKTRPVLGQHCWQYCVQSRDGMHVVWVGCPTWGRNRPPKQRDWRWSKPIIRL
jgi:hypothetical protein